MGKLKTRVEEPEQQTAAQPAVSRPRAAGRTAQGRHGGENQSYICCSELTGENPRGLYAVADGALSTKDGAAASEAVVETLKAAAQRPAHEGNGGGASSLESWVSEAHRALRESRNGMADGEHLVSSLVCALLDGDELHTAHAGNGAIYIVHSGRIQRLTENYHIDELDDPALLEEYGGKCLLGFTLDKSRPGLLTVSVAPGDTVLLCSGGVTESVDNVTMLEAATSAESPEELVAAVISKAVERGCTHDLAAVAIQIPGAVPAEKIRPRAAAASTQGKLLAAKYFSLVAMLASLSTLLYFGAEYLGGNNRAGADRRSAPASAAAPGATHIGQNISVHVDSAPRGAIVLINGQRQPGRTPLTVDAPAKGTFLLTVTMRGYKSETRLMEAPKDGSGINTSIDLLPDLEPPGDLRISCNPACEYILIDGEKVDVLKYPYSGEYTISLPPGPHTVEAGGQGNKYQKTEAEVKSDKQTDMKFDFTGNAALRPKALMPMQSAPAARPVPTPRQQVMRATEPDADEPPRAQRATPKVVVESTYPDEDSAGAPHPTKTEPKDSSLKTAAFIIVQATSADGKLQGCRIKFLQDGRLVANGYTGEAVKLAPGSYEFTVSKDGYKTHTGRKYFGAGAETVKIFMTK